MTKKIYITTPIYYASGEPHIGHAYTTVLADVISRYKKQNGCEVFFQTGMDEHGQKIEDKAKEAGIEPREYVDGICQKFKNLWNVLGIECDNFIRTSDENHKTVVQKVFSQFLQNEKIYSGMWEGLYCVPCEENYTEERAHKREDGKLYCDIGHELSYKKEESYFFKMSDEFEWIKKFFQENNEFIYPNFRIKELQNSFLDQKLLDLSVSRTTFNWGIQVKENPKHVVYVWIDALLNYISGLGYLSENNEKFNEFWENENCLRVHLMSKEITRFHCIYWPIILKNLSLQQPSLVISHGWIVTKEGKMSKSLGNVIDPIQYINEFGRDALRYYLVKKLEITNDGIFDRQMFIELFNSDLANNIGNLVSRTIGMLEKYSNGIIPNSKSTNTGEEIKAVRENIKKTLDEIDNMILNKTVSLSSILNDVQMMCFTANKYVEETKPWELKKENRTEELNIFLLNLSNIVRAVIFLTKPVLIDGMKIAEESFGFSDDQMDKDSLLNFENISGNKVSKPASIYQRIIK